MAINWGSRVRVAVWAISPDIFQRLASIALDQLQPQTWWRWEREGGDFSLFLLILPSSSSATRRWVVGLALSLSLSSLSIWLSSRPTWSTVKRGNDEREGPRHQGPQRQAHKGSPLSLFSNRFADPTENLWGNRSFSSYIDWLKHLHLPRIRNLTTD